MSKFGPYKRFSTGELQGLYLDLFDLAAAGSMNAQATLTLVERELRFRDPKLVPDVAALVLAGLR